MKKIILTGAMLVMPFAAQAAGGYSAAGCGVGAMLFEGQSGLGPHVLAATTNGFYGTQTFAMTSGTLGCDVSGTINAQASLYIDSNLDQIAADMSKGNGEALDALAAVMGVQKEDLAQFRSVMHANFTSIFQSETITGSDVASAITTVMKSDSALNKYTS
tara:strand:+ start:290 stop:769 length:480 start_codon:yes stop_codon:yes gene_type:complete